MHVFPSLFSRAMVHLEGRSTWHLHDSTSPGGGGFLGWMGGLGSLDPPPGNWGAPSVRFWPGQSFRPILAGFWVDESVVAPGGGESWVGGFPKKNKCVGGFGERCPPAPPPRGESMFRTWVGLVWSVMNVTPHQRNSYPLDPPGGSTGVGPLEGAFSSTFCAKHQKLRTLNNAP